MSTTPNRHHGESAGFFAGRQVFDTTRAVYVWESTKYPWYYIPIADVDADLLVDEERSHRTRRGTAWDHGLRVGDHAQPKAVRVMGDDAAAGLAGTVRFDWAALDAWFEEDEQLFVHPRNPYTRVDALRSSRTVRIELDGITLAESAATIMVFETGLPTRYYFDKSAVDFSRLTATATITECPYKGRTTGYWSVRTGEREYADLAWCYDFPTRQLLPIAGLVAFYNEQIDLVVDGQSMGRPVTPFSR